MVLDGQRYVGQVTRRGALQAALEHTRRPVVQYQIHTERDDQYALKLDVSSWMERDACSTDSSADVLAIAQQFLHTDARQIPVLDGLRLEGQISRCDLIRAIQKFFPAPSDSSAELPTLYLSSVNKRDAHSVVK